MSSKVLDATSGESSIFSIKDAAVSCKLVITGTPLANIKAFICQSQTEQFFLKISCASWNSAIVKLYLKTSHSEDEFSDSAVVYSKDLVDVHFFK